MSFIDTTPMPFGQHKGTLMMNVPARYLIWLEGEIKPKAPNKRTLCEKYLLEYIDTNKQVLIKEINDEDQGK